MSRKIKFLFKKRSEIQTLIFNGVFIEEAIRELINYKRYASTINLASSIASSSAHSP